LMFVCPVDLRIAAFKAGSTLAVLFDGRRA